MDVSDAAITRAASIDSTLALITTPVSFWTLWQWSIYNTVYYMEPWRHSLCFNTSPLGVIGALLAFMGNAVQI